MSYSDCKCNPVDKIPKPELPFYAKQKFTACKVGKTLPSVDMNTSRSYDKVKANEIRKQNEPNRLAQQRQRESSEFDITVNPNSNMVASLIGPENNSYQPNDTESISSQKIPRNTHEYRTYISFMRRHSVPERVIAGGLNALRIDDGISDRTMYVSKTKVNNMIKKYGEELAAKHSQKTGFECISFDGKRCIVSKSHNKKSQKAEELIAVTYEPGGKILFCINSLSIKIILFMYRWLLTSFYP